MKKSQVSVFIIIAILIVAIIGIFLIVKGKSLGLVKEKIEPEVKPIYSFVENCIKDTGERGVYYIGQTGGYFTSPNIPTEYGIAYYYNKGESYMPSKEKIEEELGNYMDYMLFFCVGEYENFSEFEIKQGEIKTKASIDDGKVVFNAEYPLTISKGDKNYAFKNFNGIEVPVRLNEIYEFAYEINQDHIENKDNICLSCIYDYAIEKDFFAEMYDHPDNETIVFTIRDEKSEILGMDYRFNFASRYELE